MAPRELWLGDLRHRAVEYLLGVGVIAVIAAIVVLQRGLAESAEGGVHDLAHKLGKNMLVVPAGVDPISVEALEFGEATMPEDYPQMIAASSLGKHVKLVHARLNDNIVVNGVPLVLIGEGSDHGDSALASQAPAAMLGPEAAQALGLSSGGVMNVGETAVVVSGIADPPPDGLGMGVFTSLATAQRLLGRSGQINTMRLGGCWCRFDVPTLAGDVEKLLPGTRAITVAGVLEAQKATVATMKRYSVVLYVVSLLMVGATVLALMVSQVRRSLREIGLLLSTGASTILVQTLVLARAGAMGSIGGLSGYLLGALLTAKLGSQLAQVPLEVEPGLWLPLAVLCGGTSLVAAALPARWAARVDPCQVLREE
jgi:hypothetical protein